MKKSAKALSICAIGILLLSLVIIFLDVTICSILAYQNYHLSILGIFSFLPTSSILDLVAMIVICTLLCFTVCSKKIGLWSEIVALGAIAVVSPGVTLISDLIIRLIITNLAPILPSFLATGSIDFQYYFASYSRYYLWLNISSDLVNLAVSLLFVACGISIIYKYIARKKQKQLPKADKE